MGAFHRTDRQALPNTDNRQLTTDNCSRRDLLQRTGLGILGAAASGWLDVLAVRAAEVRPPARRVKSCIVLWTSGGLPQTDTFDMKPEAPDVIRGAFKPIATSVPGIQVCELLPRLAQQMKHLSIIRSMKTIERGAQHAKGVRIMHNTGWVAEAPPRVEKPNLGAAISAALARPDFGIPTHVVIGKHQQSAHVGTPGFLGRQHGPLNLDEASKGIEGVKPPIERAEFDQRFKLFEELERGFTQAQSAHSVVNAHQVRYRRAVDFMQSKQLQAFDISLEPAAVRDSYGRNSWGEGCLLARRLVELGLPYVEVDWMASTKGANGLPWDTHGRNTEFCKFGLPILDAGFAALIDDLRQRGLLETTLVVCMSEFGRTPKQQRGDGRDHFGAAWSVALAGAGIKAGQVVGSTTPDGEAVKDRPVSAAELMGTICRALDVDPNLEFGARTGQKLTPETDSAQRMAAGSGVRLVGKDLKFLPELF